MHCASPATVMEISTVPATSKLRLRYVMAARVTAAGRPSASSSAPYDLQNSGIRPGPCLDTLVAELAGGIVPVQARDFAIARFIRIGLAIVVVQREVGVGAAIHTHPGQFLGFAGVQDGFAQGHDGTGPYEERNRIDGSGHFDGLAAVEALRDFPLLNASVVDDSLLVHAEVNLGIAVDLSHEGLIVPVIHRAEEVTLRGVARRIRDLAERARGRQLNADDIAGGTFSITNDGPFGTYFTVPIINQPQVAILATDGIARRPVVVTQADGSESIAIHSTGILGVSWDHRAVDGAYVSLFLAKVSELLGSRDWAAEL